MALYLLSGPEPLKPGEYPPMRPAYPQPNPVPPMGPPLAALQAYPQQPPVSPLHILQQRYARGEIDTATYEQMRDRLKE